MVLKFLSKYHKIIYYSIFIIIPSYYWYYTYRTYGGVEYYFPERVNYTVYPEKENIAFFLFYEDYPSHYEQMKIRRFRDFFCDKPEEWDGYNPCFFAFVRRKNEENSNHPEIHLYFHGYTDNGLFKNLEEFEYLEKFNYAYILNLDGKDTMKGFCSGILKESVASKDCCGKYDGVLGGGTIKEFKKMMTFMNQFKKYDSIVHQTCFWREKLNMYYKDNNPTNILEYDFM